MGIKNLSYDASTGNRAYVAMYRRNGDVEYSGWVMVGNQPAEPVGVCYEVEGLAELEVHTLARLAELTVAAAAATTQKEPAMSTITSLNNETRTRYGINAWIETARDGRTFIHTGYVQLGDADPEYVTQGIGPAGKVQVSGAVHSRATELVVFAAAAAEDHSAVPDATPTDAEAEAAQRELIELERQAGVAECRPTSSMPPCRRCGDTGQVAWPTLAGGTLIEDCPACRPAVTACMDCATAVYSGDLLCDDCADRRAWPDRPALLACCDGTGLVVGPIGAPPDAGGLSNPLPLTFAGSCYQPGDAGERAQLAALLAEETRLLDMAVFGDMTGEAAEALARQAARIRVRIGCIELFGRDSALQDLAAHVAAPGWHDLPLSEVGRFACMVTAHVAQKEAEWLPFQERAA